MIRVKLFTGDTLSVDAEYHFYDTDGSLRLTDGSGVEVTSVKAGDSRFVEYFSEE